VDRGFADPLTIEDGMNNMNSAKNYRPNQMAFGSKLNIYM